MRRGYRFLFAMALLLFSIPGPAHVLAQVPNWAELRANGMADRIEVTVDLDIGGTLPAEWVGWVVDRSTLGLCDDAKIQIGGVTPFPQGAQTYLLQDAASLAGVTYHYRILAVDSGGARYYLPGYTEFPPAYYHFDYASRSNNGSVAEGRLVDLGWSLGLEVCSDACWTEISFISQVPPDLAALLEFGTVVRIQGHLDAEFEGPYITDITGWEPIPSCFSVAADRMSWGGLKVRFR